MARAKRTNDRPFPWRCGSCDEKEVYRTPTSYKATIKYEGRPYEVEISDLEVPKCRKCGEVVFDNNAGHQINRAFRKQLGLLQPEQIRAGRTELGLSQKDFASKLGMAEESVSRWETGAQVHSRNVDRQIRVFFELPQARDVLERIERGDVLGEAVKVVSTDAEASRSGARLDWEELVGSVTRRRTELRELLEGLPVTSLAALTQEWGDLWSDCSSFWKAASHYAERAPSEELHRLTRLLASRVHKPYPREELRWFSQCFFVVAPPTSQMCQRLAKLTQDLEAVPEDDALPLLDNFASLLEVWRKRLGSPATSRITEPANEE